MVSFTSLVTLCSAALAVMAAPSPVSQESALERRSHEVFTSSTTGTYNGMYYSLYMEDSSSSTSMTDYGGTYTLTWAADAVDVVAGVGWNPGSAQTITYNGSFSTSGNAYLSVYGWTTSPLVEYYILENYGDYNPASSMTYKGAVTSDGATYDIYETTRTDAPSIESDSSTFNQYWSIRSSLRTSGTVTTANHFNAWSSLGMSMGTFNYQIVATEGYESSGSSAITVTN
ncbi:hypothetical protein H0H92_006249 [Tricholoma furcatifolium]|nr:hypothetical protein H0H92_006249 [Tricholoma furcatifolium]